MTFITVFAGGIAIEATGWQIWFWQLGSCILAMAFVYFMCPETGGKSLEEVDLVFMDKQEREVFEHEHGEFQAERRVSQNSEKSGSGSRYVEKV